ncbi:hypothetical protein O181_014861 [Austropuccinia psidii MF-1]|uniref:Uncharacterized protein n=1 Tax=Austropuccinia psidii MF-1 TaxID=1389203 RepID=A0A9Q3C2J1_9BASI|nr:hypothetical protein [Austropuccinia psidii MF-1]
MFQSESSIKSANNHQDTQDNNNTRRSTRSTTYIDDLSFNSNSSNQNLNHSKRSRSDSNDSENGWIPPPLLLPLNTKFLILKSHPLNKSSNHHKMNQSSPSLSLAHLKCNLNNNTSNSSINFKINSSLQSFGFRKLNQAELIQLSPFNQKNSSILNNHSQSDAFHLESKLFNQLHRQSEMIEKRSKKLEKEKLLHQRFKLKSHLDLLITGFGADWKSLRSSILKRIKHDEILEKLNTLNNSSSPHHPTNLDPTNHQTEWEKVDKMRLIMIKEASETLGRYDKLLDTRKTAIKPKPPPPPPSIQHLKPINKAPLKLLNNPSPSIIAESSKSIIAHDKPDNLKPQLKPIHSIKRSQSKNSKSHSSGLNSSQTNPSTQSSSPKDHPHSQIQTPKINSSNPILSPKSTLKDVSHFTPPLITTHRDSLYESQAIRRLVFEEKLTSGQRRTARLSYALGCKLPDLKQVRLDYYPRLQSLSLEQTIPSITTPFDRPERLRVVEKVEQNNRNQAEQEEKEEGEWIEFNPTVNEEKRIIERQSEFGIGSKFFELQDELEYLEEIDLEVKGIGKSIRKLVEEKIMSWQQKSQT